MKLANYTIATSRTAHNLSTQGKKEAHGVMSRSMSIFSRMGNCGTAPGAEPRKETRREGTLEKTNQKGRRSARSDEALHEHLLQDGELRNSPGGGHSFVFVQHREDATSMRASWR